MSVGKERSRVPGCLSPFVSLGIAVPTFKRWLISAIPSALPERPPPAAIYLDIKEGRERAVWMEEATLDGIGA